MVTTVQWLDPHDDDAPFPDVARALRTPDGLLAAGGSLAPPRLLRAYRHGIFPWYSADQPILWWSPDPRAVLYPDRLHVSRSLQKTPRKHEYHVTYDTAFPAVISACATARRDGRGTWLTDEMIAAYCELHRLGHAQSAESWNGDELVGGLYGVAIGQVFFGESMFARRNDASKVAIVHLLTSVTSAPKQSRGCASSPSWRWPAAMQRRRRHGASVVPRRSAGMREHHPIAAAARTLTLYAGAPHICSYLPGEIAVTQFVDPSLAMSMPLYSQLVDMGFRRSGEHVYRPRCRQCDSCIPARIPVDAFTPSRQQRRVWRHNEDLVISVAGARDSESHFALYRRFLAARHAGGGMDVADPDQYQAFLFSPWSVTECIEYRAADRLVAVAIVDRLQQGL